MPGNAVKLLSMLSGAAACAGIAYTAFALTRVRRFERSVQARRTAAGPPITVLKPLYGVEPALFENLSSFCDQDYPEYQIVFSAARADDPALEVARAVSDRFPDRDIAIVAGEGKPAANPKIGNLLGAMGRARHPIVVIADSDIRVGRTYLQAVAASFADPRTGAATCIYGAIPQRSLAARIGAMHVNDFFAPSVMVACALEPLTYCFGATMAVRRDVLDGIGGLASIADHLGDDYVLGKLVTQAGYRVELVPYAVQTTVADDTPEKLWRHEVRWSRTIFAQRPAGYAGSVVTYGVPLAAIFACLARTPFSAGVLALACALRVVLHYEARRTFAPSTRATPWLIPVRDAFGVAVWAAAFFGKRVLWKSDEYHLAAGGRMASGPREV